MHLRSLQLYSGAEGGSRTRTPVGHYPLKIARLPIPPLRPEIGAVKDITQRIDFKRRTCEAAPRGQEEAALFPSPLLSPDHRTNRTIRRNPIHPRHLQYSELIIRGTGCQLCAFIADGVEWSPVTARTSTPSSVISGRSESNSSITPHLRAEIAVFSVTVRLLYVHVEKVIVFKIKRKRPDFIAYGIPRDL